MKFHGYVDLPQTETKSYPHAIFHDFESYGDNNQRKEPTNMLTIENAHEQVSVSIENTLERDPAVLVRKFMEELERRGKNIREQVLKEFHPKDADLLPKQQKKIIWEWLNQVPVLGSRKPEPEPASSRFSET